MDLLYILSNGSKFNNDELKYSLRTVEKHFKGVDNIVIVGERPDFISDEIKYHYIKEAEGNKEYCIAKKILTACELGYVKGDFLFMNDDFFFTKEVDANDYPYYYKGCLSEEAPDPNYNQSIINTYEYLKNNNKSTLHFDVHTPIIYNTDKFIGLKEAWEKSKSHYFGMVVKSTYCNWYGIEGEIYEDAKIHELLTASDFERIYNTNCFSCSDLGWVHGIADYLEVMYPNPSKYEKVLETTI